jgi:predicted transcriptional regulator
VVKRRDLQGGLAEDALHSSLLQKVTTFKRGRVYKVIDENPRLSLRDIVRVANIGLNSISI